MRILANLFAWIGATAIVLGVVVLHYIPLSGLATILSDSCRLPEDEDHWLEIMATRADDGRYHVLCWQLELSGSQRHARRAHRQKGR